MTIEPEMLLLTTTILQ